MSARLIIITRAHGPVQNISYKWIPESDVDAAVDGYLAEIGELKIDWDQFYSSPVSNDAKVFMGLRASDENDPAFEKKEFVRDGFPLNMTITHVYSIQHFRE